MSLILRKRKFSPRQLFAAGEIGAWYEPSALDTLYQTSTGTTAVTAGEQPVGLVLDKSKGLALGPELVTNGGFDSGTTGWTAVLGSLSVVGGALRVTSTGGEARGRQSGIPTVVGRTYRLVGNWTFAVAKIAYFRVRDAAGTQIATGSSSSASGTRSLVFVATTSTTMVDVATDSSYLNGEYVDVDNISVRELPGSHALQSSSTLRPTYKTGPNRLSFDADPDSLTITFPSAPGNSTIAYGVSGGEPVITYPVNISGTTYTMNPTNTGANNTGLVIVNRALTAAETVKLTQYLKARS